MPRSARTSSSATRVRPRAITTSCSRSSSAAQLDWCGFFSFSREEGTYAADLDGHVESGLVAERLGELRSMQDDITARKREALIGSTVEVLVDARGVARSHREAPEIDGIIEVPQSLAGRCVLDGHDLRGDGARPRRRPSGLTMATSFGPSALATPANGVTVGRLLAAPFLFVMIDGTEGSWPSVHPLVRAVRHRWHRRVPRSAARHDAIGRLPRPARRQGARPRRDARAGQAGRVLVVAGRADRRARDRDQHVPQHGGPSGHHDPGASGREGQDRVPAVRSRVRVAAVVG